MRELYKTFVNGRLNEISKNQIYKFSNVSKTLKKDNYFTNLIKIKNLIPLLLEENAQFWPL